MNLTYSIRLDKTTLKDTDLDTLFGEIEIAFNAGLVEPHNLDFGSINYRHLDRPPKFALGTSFGYPLAFTFSIAYTGYYVINESVVYHDSSHTTAPNRDVTGQGVTHLIAILHASDVGDSNLADRACIGVSNDGGTTWTPITTQTSRPFGLSCGNCIRVFDSTSQPHYITAAAGYEPFNFNFDRGVVLVASYGGDLENARPAGPDAFCVMLNSNTVSSTVIPLVKGQLFLNARERSF